MREWLIKILPCDKARHFVIANQMVSYFYLATFLFCFFTNINYWVSYNISLMTAIGIILYDELINQKKKGKGTYEVADIFVGLAGITTPTIIYTLLILFIL